MPASEEWDRALEQATRSGRIEADLEAASREGQILRWCQAQIPPSFQQSEGEVLGRTDALLRGEGLTKQAAAHHELTEQMSDLQ